MALNLVRNSKVFFTTNVNASTGVINPASTTAFSNTNTFEIQVLDGFTFSQNANNETVTLNEAGLTPVRGQRSFNTSLAPVDFSFSTYIRPRLNGSVVTAEESVLWNAMFSAENIVTPTSITGVSGVTSNATGLVSIAGTAMTNLPVVGDVIVLQGVTSTTPAGNEKYLNSAGTVVTSTATSITVQLFTFGVAVTASTLVTASTVKYGKFAWHESNASFSQVTTGVSDKNQLQKFGLLFLVDNVLYAIDNAAMNEATVDFSLDGIATVQWTGQATALRQFSTAVTANAGSFAGGTTNDVGTGTYKVKDTAAAYITNKLSVVALSAARALGSAITNDEVFSVPLTGGSITISNNITYITPANLGTVNLPITYFTGTRSISGNITAYLRTGESTGTGNLLADLLAESATAIEPMFALTVNVGGTTGPRVAFDMPAVSLGIPSVDVQQVVSATINFTAQGSIPSGTANGEVYDLTKPNELAIRYSAA